MPAPVTIEPPFQLTVRVKELEEKIKSESAKPGLRTGLFALETGGGRYVDVDGHDSFAAASMIKIPVLVALMIAVDKHQASLDQMLTLRQELTAGGSGFLQWRPLGSQVSVSDAAELMIKVSDNTATNLIIDLLGGAAKLNSQFVAWGLRRTEINNQLPDFEGTNKTSPYDLAFLLAKIDHGFLVSELSKRFIYRLMEHTRTRTLLPMGLGLGAKIAHKTGDIGIMVGDAGIVTTASGRRYVVAVQVERPHNDRRANQLIRDLSRIVYDGLIVSAPTPASLDASARKPRSAADSSSESSALLDLRR